MQVRVHDVDLVLAHQTQQVGDGAQLGPLTLVMKGESIPAGTRWHGLPAAPWR